jgi:hypothetical protein
MVGAGNAVQARNHIINKYAIQLAAWIGTDSWYFRRFWLKRKIGLGFIGLGPA